MRVQLGTDDKGVMLIVTDSETGQQMATSIPPDLARNLGDRLFTLGCEMEARQDPKKK